MSRPFIIVGDTTSHGGRVITGDYTTEINGKPVARINDMTVCPRCKGTFPITTASPDTFISDRPVARHGDLTACGATLISSQMLTQWINSRAQEGEGNAEPTAEIKKSLAEAVKSGICLDCLLKAANSGAALVVRQTY